MKLVKYFLVLCLTVCTAGTGWAQRKEILRGTVQAVTSEILPATLLRGSSSSALLAHTRLFMQTHDGRLPKRTLYANKHPISTYDMSEEQLWEVRLARQVYSQIKNAPATPDRDLEELASLYE